MKALRRTVGSHSLLRFLKSRRSYPGHPRRLHLLQTHASWVALTDRFVYKVKKSANFGFLDFSTLERRRNFCNREVLLNRRLCPGLYLGVIPIRRTGRVLTFHGGGEIVEYVVKMRRLAERYFLLRILKDGQLTKRHIDRVIATLKPFYTDPRLTCPWEKWGRVSKLKESTTENFRQTQPFLGKTIDRPVWEAIRNFTARFFRLHDGLFRARTQEGRIRDCHGDLHLEHIHVAPGEVNIYDCIEFNDRFRLIDVANDLAFLAMDLDFHGRADLGRYLVTRMAKVLRDPGMIHVLNFYKCYRACVRGKVESFRSAASGVGRRGQGESQRLARQYFRLALQYAIGGSKPMVLIVMGQAATGKSTLVGLLAHALGWSAFSSDRLRKKLAGVPLHVRGSAAERTALYSRRMSDRTYGEALRCAVSEARLGRGAILDATFAQRDRRTALITKLKMRGIDYCFIETRASRSTVRLRLAGRAHLTNEVSDARLEDQPALERSYEPPKELDPRHLLSVKTSGTADRALTTLLRALARRRASLLEPP